MNFIKNNFLTLIILVLVGVIIFQRCGNKPVQPKPTVIVKVDTVFVPHDTIIQSKPTLKESAYAALKKEPESAGSQWIIDTIAKALPIWIGGGHDILNTDTSNFIQSYGEFHPFNQFIDTLTLKDLGYVCVLDTVFDNQIIGRSYKVSLKTPLVTREAVTQVSKNQLYIGGGIGGSPSLLINDFQLGLLYKTRKDRIYTVSAGITPQQGIHYIFSTYWKIHF